jgi:type I restriction enzyme S subunit
VTVVWEEKKLGDVLALEYGKPLPPSERSAAGRYAVYGANGIKDRSDKFYSDRRSIIVGRKGSAGEITLTEDKFWPLDVTYFVTFDEAKYDLRFLYHLLSLQDLTKLAKGVKPGINRNEIYSKSVRVPLLPEQQRIVAILDEAFAGLATATANAEKNLNNARELFDSYLDSIFGQGWATQALGDTCENLDSKRIPVTKRDRKFGDIPYYGASGAVDYVHDFIFDEGLLLVSEDGANLVMRTYPIAFSISGKSWVNNHAHVLRFPDLASQKFVEYYLNSISLMPYVNGMAQPKLNQKALNSIPIPWPGLGERESVAARLEELAAQTERLRELYETRITALAELKQSILHMAFSGELTSPPSQAIKEAAE